jgi:hypothetical protein
MADAQRRTSSKALNNFNVKSNGKGDEFMEQAQCERRPLSIEEKMVDLCN